MMKFHTTGVNIDTNGPESLDFQFWSATRCYWSFCLFAHNALFL